MKIKAELYCNLPKSLLGIETREIQKEAGFGTHCNLPKSLLGIETPLNGLIKFLKYCNLPKSLLGIETSVGNGSKPQSLSPKRREVWREVRVYCTLYIPIKDSNKEMQKLGKG